MRTRNKAMLGIAVVTVALVIGALFVGNDSNPLDTKSVKDGNITVYVQKGDGSEPEGDNYLSDVRIESVLTDWEPDPLEGKVQIFKNYLSFSGTIGSIPYNMYGMQKLGMYYPHTQEAGVFTIMLQSDLFLNPGEVSLEYAKKLDDGSIAIGLKSVEPQQPFMYEKPPEDTPNTTCLIYLNPLDVGAEREIFFFLDT